MRTQGELGSRLKRRRAPAIAAVTVVALVAMVATLGAGSAAGAKGAPSFRTCPTRSTPASLGPKGRAWVSRTMAQMTLPEKVGQLFEVNGYGQSAEDPNPQMVALNQQYYGVDNIAQLIQKYHPGGIIYFNWSNTLQQPSQVLGLSNGIQQVTRGQHPSVPMVISVDQEGGEVIRVGAPATVFPGNMPLGATRSNKLARQAAAVGGQELRAMGINVDNAPVVDNNVQPLNQADGIRAYGDRVNLVSRLGVAQVHGYQCRQGTTGVGATLKHWPGFGAGTINSDDGVATSPQTLRQVRRQNLPSFRAALKAGADRVMVTHLLFPKITGSTITSLSRYWITKRLRHRLHYHGPVVTDALNAAALNEFSAAQVALLALRAGNDELIEIARTGFDNPPADLVTAYPAVLNAVNSGAMSKKRLETSVRRILTLKWKLGLVHHRFSSPTQLPKVVGTSQHLAVARQVAARSITVLRNSAGTLPLRSGTGADVLVTGFGQLATATVGSGLAARGLDPNVQPSGYNPNDTTIAATVAAAQQSDLVMVNSFNAWGAPGQLKLINALLGTGKPVIVVGVGTPYDVAYLGTAQTFVATYAFNPPSMNAMLAVLFGETSPQGKLPVTIRSPASSGQVLYPFGFSLALGS